MAVKNPSKWTPQSGEGYVVNQGNLNLIDNLGNDLQDNFGSYLVTNITYDTPKKLSLWQRPGKPTDLLTQDGKILQTQSLIDIWLFQAAAKSVDQWNPPSGEGYVINVGSQNFADNLGHLLTDNTGNAIVTNPTHNTPKYLTAWAESGV